MVNCPRCQSPADEKARATCPVCFAPLRIPSVAPAIPPMPAGPQSRPQAPNPPSIPPLAGMAPPVAGTPTQHVPAQYAPPQASYAQPVQSYSAPPAVPPPAPGRQARVSLTGEVVETPVQPPASGYAPQGQVRSGYGAPPGGMPALPDYIARGAGSVPLPTAPVRPSISYGSSGGMSSYFKIRLAIAGIGLIIALFAYIAKAVSESSGSGGSPSSGAPFGGFSFGSSSNPESGQLHTPETAAQCALQALHYHDWRKLYYVCAFENNERKTASEADDFQRELDRAATINHNPLTAVSRRCMAIQRT